jgi:hypothetical protein
MFLTSPDTQPLLLLLVLSPLLPPPPLLLPLETREMQLISARPLGIEYRDGLRAL